VYASVKSKIRDNLTLVLNEAKRKNKLPIDVALDIAKERVRKAMELRGRIPKRA